MFCLYEFSLPSSRPDTSTASSKLLQKCVGVLGRFEHVNDALKQRLSLLVWWRDGFRPKLFGCLFGLGCCEARIGDS